MKTKFPGTSETALFRNSVYYTDYALGQFLREARQAALVRPHAAGAGGRPRPPPARQLGQPEPPAKFHIPLVLAGGALRPEARGRVVHVIGSQTDVAATLLHQLRLPATAFVWSRDLLAAQPRPVCVLLLSTMALGRFRRRGMVTFDNVSRQVVGPRRGVPDAQLQLGQAMEQVIAGGLSRASR